MSQEQQWQEMDAVFQGVDFVRLRSGRASYVHAAEDGRSVRLDACRASHNSVWAVTRSLSSTTGLHCVLLRGAYGRYLGAPDAATARGRGYLLCCPCSSTCRAAAQRDFDKPEVLAILWRVVPTSREGVFRLQDASGRYLRANPRRLLPCRSGVSVSTARGLGKEVQWVVEPVPRGARPPDLPIPRDSLFARVCPPLSRLCVRCFSPWLEREIRFVVSDGSVDISEANWIPRRFTGRRTTLLKRQLVGPQPPQLIRPQYTLCVRAGLYGEPTPLAINLPRSRERLDIVLFPYSVSVVDEFIYPDVNAVAGAAAPARIEPVP